jgi:hypothetical protein
MCAATVRARKTDQDYRHCIAAGWTWTESIYRSPRLLLFKCKYLARACSRFFHSLILAFLTDFFSSGMGAIMCRRIKGRIELECIYCASKSLARKRH